SYPARVLENRSWDSLLRVRLNPSFLRDVGMPGHRTGPRAGAARSPDALRRRAGAPGSPLRAMVCLRTDLQATFGSAREREPFRQSGTQLSTGLPPGINVKRPHDSPIGQTGPASITPP